jgi:hypothetical protein
MFPFGFHCDSTPATSAVGAATKSQRGLRVVQLSVTGTRNDTKVRFSVSAALLHAVIVIGRLA